MTKQNIPTATLSVDLDNLWCYQRSFGIETWKDYPSFLHLAVPRLLNLLDEQNLRLTTFIVGRDAANATNQTLLADVAHRGHEIGNHSFDHDTQLHLQPKQTIAEDLIEAETAIVNATGQKPIGFRGPAYGLSLPLLETLAELNYVYDTSTFPNFLGFIARRYHRSRAANMDNKAVVHDSLYGSLRTGMQPLRPYVWKLNHGVVLESPVSSMPILRLPFHGTYLNYLAEFSSNLSITYFRLCLALCRVSGVAPSLLLHATDFIGCDDPLELAYLPGMKNTVANKMDLMKNVLSIYKETFDVIPIGKYVRSLEPVSQLSHMTPDF